MLGFLGGKMRDLADDKTVSKIFGSPFWLHDGPFPHPEWLVCSKCSESLSLVVQAYSPLELKSTEQSHRSLYLFACNNKGCHTNKSWTLIRGQAQLTTEELEELNEENFNDEDREDWGEQSFNEEDEDEEYAALRAEIERRKQIIEEQWSDQVPELLDDDAEDKEEWVAESQEDWGGNATEDWGVKGADDWGDDAEEGWKQHAADFGSEKARESNPTTPTKSTRSNPSTPKKLATPKKEGTPKKESTPQKVKTPQKEGKSSDQPSTNQNAKSALPSFLLEADEEPKREKLSKKDRDLFAKYADLTVTGGGEEWTGEEYECPKLDDKYFQKFQKRIARAPDQILRYSFGGKELWMTPEVPSQIPNCEGCGAKRVFEMQLLSTLLFVIKDTNKKVKLNLDFGTVVCFSCSQSCSSSTTTIPSDSSSSSPCFYTREFAFSQESL
jgi:hypothetical protein